MKKIFILILLLPVLINVSLSQEDKTLDDYRLLARVYLDSPRDFDQINGLYIDLVNRTVTKHADIITCMAELKAIQDMGFHYEILDITDKSLMIDPEYHTYEECMQAMHQFASEYPEITKLDTIGTSHLLGYYILSMKISDNPEIEEDEMAILYDGQHHAREPVSMETCLAIIEHLLTNYNVDPDVTAWINNTEIYVVPMLNPDGWMYIVDDSLSSPWWRKNLHDNDGNGSFEPLCDGVDLNRNYDFNWVHGIHDPCDWFYCGTESFSEKETQAKRDIAFEQKFVMSITYHSFGEYVVALQGSLGQPMPDTDLYYNLAAELASRIPKVDSGSYDVDTDDYCMAGYSDCWMYFTQGTFEFTVETAPSFIPDGDDALLIAQDNIEGAMYLLERIYGPGVTGIITDVDTGEPLVARVWILDYDNETINARMSDELYGRYTRLLLPGNYSFVFSADDYFNDTIYNVNVGDELITQLDIQLTPVPSNVGEQESEDDFVLYQNAPNPVTGSTEVRYEISGNQNVILTVYDSYGRKVSTLIDKIQGRGEHKVSYNTSSLSSGVYIIHLSAGNNRTFKKFIKL